MIYYIKLEICILLIKNEVISMGSISKIKGTQSLEATKKLIQPEKI